MGDLICRKERRARKARRCDICCREITPGEKYVHAVSVDGGKIGDWDMHSHCETLVERYCMAMGVNEYDAQDVEWWAQDEVCSNCDKRADACDHTALTCPAVLNRLLPPTLLADESVRRYIDANTREITNHG